MGVTLRDRKNKTGTVSLYLDICYGKTRVREYLNFILNGDKKRDQKLRKLATAIRNEREMQILTHAKGVVSESRKLANFYLFESNYKYFRYKYVVKSLKDYSGLSELPCSKITQSFCEGYLQHMKEKYEGTTPKVYFMGFKKMVRDAVREKYMADDPTKYIVLKGFRQSKPIVSLSPDQIKLLSLTPCKVDVVKRMCLFMSQTGIRFCDIRVLTWENNIIDDKVVFKQSKGYVNAVPMNKGARKQIGQSGEGLVFKDLPDGKTVNQVIVKWVKAAGIKQHVTKHIFRHAFVTNVGKLKGIHIAGKLAGHSTVAMTERYSHLIDSDRIEAVDSLPEI